MTWAIEERSYSQRPACALVGLDPKTYRYRSRCEDDTALRRRLRDLASERRSSVGDTVRPHMRLDWLAPDAFANRLATSQNPNVLWLSARAIR